MGSVGQTSWSRTHILIVRKTEKIKIVKNMGVIRKIVLSLLLVATLAHGQWSVDLNAPLQHHGKIQQEYSPGNIYKTNGDSPGQPFYPFDPLTNSKSQHRNGGYGSDSNKWESLSFNGFVNHVAYNFIEGISGVIIWTLIVWLVGSQTLEKLGFKKLNIGEKPAEELFLGLKLITGNKPTEEEKRMFKGIEDGAIANIMTSIDEFKTKYLN